MDLYRLTIQDSQDSMQFDLLDAPIKIEDVEGAVDNTVLTGDIFTDYLFLKKRWEQKWAIMCKDEYERLRGFYTRQWSLATVPSVKVTQGYIKSEQWQGKLIYIDAPDGGGIDRLTKLDGDTEQHTMSGKNLLNINVVYAVGTTQSGMGGGVDVTFNADGSITLDGTQSTTNIQFTGANDVLKIPIDPSKTYKMVCEVMGGSMSPTSNEVLAYDCRYNGGASVAYRNFTFEGSSTVATLNTSNTEYITRVRLYRNTSADGNATFSNLKLRLGLYEVTEDDEFQPYCGAQPSPNPQYPQPFHIVEGKQTVDINGTQFPIDLKSRNLFDKANAQIYNGYLGSGMAIVNSAGTEFVYIPCKPNTTYTAQKTNSGTNQRYCLFTIDTEPTVGVTALNYVGSPTGLDTSSANTITTPATAKYLCLFYKVGNTTPSTSDILDTVQIEEGYEATQYVSYFDYKLAKVKDALDSIKWDGFDWYMHKEIEKATLTSSFAWTTGSFNSQKRIYTSVTNIGDANKPVPNNDSIAEIVSDYFTAIKMNDLLTGTSDGIGISSSNYLSIRDASQASSSDFLDWLDTNKPRIIYTVKTPVETVITEQELIDQLDAIRATFQETNTIEISPVSPNLAPTMTLRGAIGAESTVLAQTNVRIGLSDGGVLNACECRQNVTLSMRETA